MKHTALHSAGAPSSTLLKFLRAQNRGVPFFNSSASQLSCAGSSSPSCAFITSRSRRPSARSLVTQAAPFRHLESTFFSLETLWPKRRTRQARERESSSAGSWQAASQSRYSDRPISTTSKRDDGYGSKGFWHWRRQDRQPPPADALPGLSSFLDENSAIGKPLRGANELKLRCTELDEQGNVTLRNGEFKKGELIARVSISATWRNTGWLTPDSSMAFCLAISARLIRLCCPVS